MNIGIRYIPREENTWNVTRAIAQIVHSEAFAPRGEGERLINFEVNLNESRAGGVGNDGTGILIMPTIKLGYHFLDTIKENPIKMGKQKLKFYKMPTLPPEWKGATLAKTPFVNPDREEEREKKMRELGEKFRLDTLQFGTFFRRSYPNQPRAFSVEWSKDLVRDSYGYMEFNYDDKLIRLHLGDPLNSNESKGFIIDIHLSSIQKIGTGYDGKPYICFNTHTPPILERLDLHRSLTGNYKVDTAKYKERVGYLDEAHEVIAAYAHQVRVVLYPLSQEDVVSKFVSMCKIAGLADGLIAKFDRPHHRQIEACGMGFFTRKRLHALHGRLRKFSWPIAFQIEALLRNGILNTDDIETLIPDVTELEKKKTPVFVGEILRKFNEALRSRTDQEAMAESPLQCLKKVIKSYKRPAVEAAFLCYHATIAPTRMILEGPTPSDTNRVLRSYRDYEEHFLRVDFKDEDRLQYRWDRAVDGSPFLEQRVGKTLKEGFELGGRRFEFLAYSSSALREHSVWFVHQFDHAVLGRVTGQTIRDSLGDFKGTELMKQPSKYAARLAQAFTATEPSVDILQEHWEEVPDLGKDPYLFTDGVGTISRAFAIEIWKEYCKNMRKDFDLTFVPCAYQIRFLGYKGVVVVDDELDRHPEGIKMRLRPSMRKFEVKDAKKAPLEIARPFEYPNTPYLNRPLITLLEDEGVRPQAFMRLQEDAVADARTIDDSLSQFYRVITRHGLGNTYGLRRILDKLQNRFGMELYSTPKKPGMDNAFFRQIRQVAEHDILRDIKHSARIPIPNSYMLVGVADEGMAYKGQPGYEDVFCLQEGQVYVCVQETASTEPIWLQGNVSVSRSPVLHPGDVQRVSAVGKPPDNVICMFRNLRNVVVFPSVGERSMPSCLGGGDVDGDLFSVIAHDPILPTSFEAPAAYNSLPPFKLNRDSRVSDICDFIVRYIESDLLGLLSDRWLIIADQSSEGIRDESCLRLAELCSHAVDFPKNGTSLDFGEEDGPPKTLIRCKPDWHAAEVVSPRHTDYYESDRVLGQLFRSISLTEPTVLSEIPRCEDSFSDPISIALFDSIEKYLGPEAARDVDSRLPIVPELLARYQDELRYISVTHTISNAPGIKLLEAEIVVGTILAKCSQKRFRKDRVYKMKLHSASLVRSIKEGLVKKPSTIGIQEILKGLGLAWKAWHLSLRRRNEFGASSFGLIALGTIIDCLEELDKVMLY